MPILQDVSYNEFYPRGVEPWEPNITALLDRDTVKWRLLMEPGTPLPTPWDKELYDRHLAEHNRLVQAVLRQNKSHGQMDSLRTVISEWTRHFMRGQRYSGKVGAFEGCGYVSSGFYRPFMECLMFSASTMEFDPVCKNAIIRVMDFHTR